MIYVDRTRVKEPSILCTEGKGGLEETRRNLEFIKNEEWEKVKFSVYADSEVKETLIDLFHGKCAYCESKCLHVYSGDVEHFRPKGEIKEATSPKPGYYWLAADWNNLLLSCRNCNQNLNHNVFGSNEKKTLGKMNQFPLHNSYKHVQSHENHPHEILKEEQYRLLINPCIDKAEEYFEYDRLNGVIKPTNDDPYISLKAETSIQVYALQRMPLVQAREKVLIKIFAQIQRVVEAIENLNNSLGSASTERTFIFDKILKRELEYLKKFTYDEEEYAGMARQIIGDIFG